jgi:fructuronate reductase
MPRLNADTSKQLAETVIQPTYNREATGAGIVHLGVGAFHRGHQAWYTEKVLNQCGGDWGIVGASLRSSTVHQQLQPQDCLYTVLERDSENQKVQLVGAIKDIIVAPEHPGRLLTLLSAESIKVVTLTITEKGYCYDFSSDDLDWDNPDIIHDLFKFPFQPKTAIAYLVAALRERRAKQLPLTLISCDNLPANGKVLKRVVTAFAAKIDSSLADWIESSVAFPCSMVDRIVPATTDEDIQDVNKLLGVEDKAVVVTEPFSQWIIERDFKTDIPGWDKVGALYVDDVTPFEEMKLRLLNGSHSIIAYLGYLAGFDYVHQVIAHPVFERFIRRYMDEIAGPTLSIPAGFDLAAYKEQLIQRFANKSLNHKTSQIAQDGSQKISQRWLSCLRENLEQGRDISLLVLAIAGWIRYLQGHRDNNETYEIIDPLSDKLVAIARQHTESLDLVKNILAVEQVFGGLNDQVSDLAAQMSDFHKQIEKHGVIEVLTHFA